MNVHPDTPAAAQASLQARIVARCDRLVEKTGLAAATISRKVLLDSDRLDQLRGGESWLRPPTAEDVLKRLAELEAQHGLDSEAAA